MTRLIDTGLKQMTEMVLRMGELASEAVSLSLKGYVQDINAYEEVEAISSKLITMAEEAEDKALELIARFQPVASDLRIIKSYMKVTYDLARYGRYALDISQIYMKLGGLKECEDWIRRFVMEMGEKVLNMVRISTELLKSRDTNLASSLSEIEKQVDNMYFKYLDILVEKVPATNKCMMSSILVVRHLERIADHASYIGESIIYLIKGEKVTLR